MKPNQDADGSSQTDFSERRRLLIVTHHFPPKNTIGAVRVGAFARDLELLGWDVRVVTPPRLGPIDDRAAARRDGSLNAEFPTPRASSPPPAPGFARVFRSKLRRALGLVFRRAVAVPDPEMFAWIPWGRVIDTHSSWRPHIILASGPPFSIFLLASRMSDRLDVPWVADYRDLWSNGSYFPYGSLRRRLERKLERRALRTVAGVVTVSEPLAADLRTLTSAPARVVMNGFDPVETPEIQQMHQSAFRLVYTGEIYPEKRDPGPLFEAIKQLDLEPGRLIVEFYGSTVEPVLQMAHDIGVGDHVKAHAKVTQQVARGLQAHADALLLLLWNHPGEVGVFSGKLFEYIGSRKPVLMLGYERGVAAHLVRERNVGEVANSPEQIAAVLSRWMDMKDRGETLQIPTSALQGLTRLDQSRVLSEFLGAMTSGRDVGGPRAA